MATGSCTRARFLGVALAAATTSSAQLRQSSFIGETVIQRGVQVPARGLQTRPERGSGPRAAARRTAALCAGAFVRDLNKDAIAAEPLAESRAPP